MKQNRFIILIALAAVGIALGGLMKHTVLKDLREQPLYLYDVDYTVEARDILECQLTALQADTPLYLEDKTIMGTITSCKALPAASGEENCYDLTLTVSSIGGKLENISSREYDLTENNVLTFYTRYVIFDGAVTHVSEVKE